MRLYLPPSVDSFSFITNDVTFTGKVTLQKAPSDSTDATTKSYVDSSIAIISSALTNVSNQLTTQINTVNTNLNEHIENSSLHLTSQEKSFLENMVNNPNALNISSQAQKQIDHLAMRSLLGI